MSTDKPPQGESASVRKPRPRQRAAWWRAYAGLPTSPRWRVAARRSRRPVTEVLGVVLYLLDIASAAIDRGDIAGFDAEECAVGLDLETADVETIVAALLSTGWLSDGRIATWDDRQTDKDDPTSNDRQRRKRERDRAAAEGVTPSHGDVTPGHARGEEIRADQRRSESLRYDSSAPDADLQKRIGRFFDERVWPAYPKGKVFYPPLPARKKFVEMVLAGTDPEEILAGVERYADSAPDPRYVRAPVKFLEDEDWNNGESIGEREWDANQEETLWLPIGPPAEDGEPTAAMRETADILYAGFFGPDGKRRKTPQLPRYFGKPPIGGWLAAA